MLNITSRVGIFSITMYLQIELYRWEVFGSFGKNGQIIFLVQGTLEKCVNTHRIK
jgi:hypothetical protein